jgi:putative ABC transport system permease protein
MMRLSFQVREAFLNLRISKLRSILAVLGILVGTASVVAMVSGGELATRQVLAQFQSLGTNLLAMQLFDKPNQSSSSAPTVKLSYQQAMDVQKINPNITAVAPYANLYSPIAYDGHTIQASIIGATRDLSALVRMKLAQGRLESYMDGYEHYAVIGNQVYKSIKQYSAADPVGQQIMLGKNIFTIVGVLKPWESNPFIYENVNSSILVPINAASVLSKQSDIGNILFRLKSGADINQTENAIKQYFTQLMPDKQIYFRSAEELISHMKSQQNILTLFLGFVGGIALLVGGIGVMNIMLVSVTERRREIGIRKAIGAKKWDIRSLFLIEAIVLSLFGGISGVILGELTAWLIAFIKHWPFSVFIGPVLIGFFVSVIAGIFFGVYPAFKASNVDPIESLHAE